MVDLIAASLVILYRRTKNRKLSNTDFSDMLGTWGVAASLKNQLIMAPADFKILGPDTVHSLKSTKGCRLPHMVN